ncbi:hypothetical protein [uncultured Agrococcus sp.]|uniref:hypothetical protein n=1 Tax=uncultured Agrococcus sp. TaxID=382258 RepID=UPI0025ED3B85|nr:hypothetical protein [uncultured Agrococcus sp.]
MAKRLTAKQRRARTYSVLVAVVLVAGLVWAAVWWFSGDATEDATEPTPTETELEEEPSPSPSVTVDYDGLGPDGLPSDAPACEIDVIEIQAMTDQQSYGSGDPVLMHFMLVNGGNVPCQVNVGTTQQDYVISAGGETVFQSSDCMSDRVDQLVTLEPDEPRETQPIEWDRRYSDEGNCDEELDRVPANGTEYTLTVVVAGIESQGTREFVLQ